MADTEAAVETFLDKADAVFADYENGYTDPDDALAVLEAHVDALRDDLE
ncbi:hypothetical protein [Halococcus sp. IIIV-5B]|nr:hypothetical protein [Halococcus sp. IIIV-5B]